MRRARAALAAAVVLLASACTGPGGPKAEPTATPSDSGSYAAELERLVNEERTDAGLDPLVHDDCAAAGAQERATALVGQAELTHAPLTEVLTACGVERAGENLSSAAVPPREVVDAWLGSTGHLANIIDEGFTAGAVACAQDGPEQTCSHIFLEK